MLAHYVKSSCSACCPPVNAYVHISPSSGVNMDQFLHLMHVNASVMIAYHMVYKH